MKNRMLRVLNIIKVMVLVVVALVIYRYNSVNGNVEHIFSAEETEEQFRNGAILICNNTLIVDNKSWTLVDDNLIHKEIAGHIEIKECRVQE